MVLGATATVLVAASSPPAHSAHGLACGQVVSGTVKLDQDLACAGTDGLIVGADNTAIDLNGHTIACRTVGTGYQGSCQGIAEAGHQPDEDPENGIDIDGRRNVRIFSSHTRRGTIDGFDNGIQSTNSSGVTIESLIISGPPQALPAASRPPSHAIAMYGDSCASPNRIGGTGLFSGNELVNHNEGIALQGSCVEVTHNWVHDNNSTGPVPSSGILLEQADNMVVRNNRVIGNGDAPQVGAELESGRDGGITLSRGSDANLITGNAVNDNLGDGISVRDGSGANKIDANTMLGNGEGSAEVPFADATGRVAGTANDWSQSNVCVTQLGEVPPGTCGRSEARSLAIDDPTVTENQSKVRFTVSLSYPSRQPVSVDFATADDSARAPEDYVQTSETVTFGPSEVKKTVTVQVNNDTLDEPDERFLGNLSNPAGATIADGQGAGTIKDDDGAAPAGTIRDDGGAAPGRPAAARMITPSGVGAVQLGTTYRRLRQQGLVKRIRRGCELGGRATRSAGLRAPLRGHVNFTLRSPRRVTHITIRGGATARGVGIGAKIPAIEAAYPNAKVDRATGTAFALTLVKIPKNGGGRLQFGVSRKTKEVTLIGIPSIAFCE
jgi:parallel beta-helix repeat protein